jgi:hypothetical protein
MEAIPIKCIPQIATPPREHAMVTKINVRFNMLTFDRFSVNDDNLKSSQKQIVMYEPMKVVPKHKDVTVASKLAFNNTISQTE